MEAERFQRVDELFDAALDLSPADRARFLAQHCASDHALRGEVERLLDLDAMAHSFLVEPAAGRLDLVANFAAEISTVVEPPPPALPLHLGPYRLLQPLGAGSQATVFLARREESTGTADDVVLKLLSTVALSAEATARRLDDLYATLGQLDHPALARWHGFETDAGRLFLMLEAVPGTPVDRFSDHLCLRVEERLRLFLRLSHAVADLHRHGIAHGSLHPQNILVTADGTLKLLDTGLHRLRAPSPAADDLAGDVRALGVLLYRLLAGHPPAENHAEIEPPSALVAATAPDKSARLRRTTPKRLTRRLRGGLDTLVLDALASSPPLPFPTVGALTIAVGRHI